ncbi:extracellular catalytic domain type 1 short-chain-length polyhydroxyalkanoate depolymerase [Methylobacterium planeticum]|uniref:PHB depolymerase family esterase n=1 Tax=Methylobacterium planeticum TaxID=2615211 RepID=A0A6N6MSH6_9HYPH|nr:PHB depolymerase family esterase [Methylobacterium planeticum]KAB1072351.1 PHB depolymerase family esterase [Methylobacterium planeticum]
MTAFGTIDIGEVTRLTRAGKLAEAMALLKGQEAPGPAPKEAGRSARASAFRSIIDMVPPAQAGGAWTAPGSPGQAKAAAFPDLGETMRTFRERLATPGALPGLGEGFGRGLGEGVGPARQAPPVPDGARFEERSFTAEAGSRTYKVFVPSGYTGQALPVVVMLHGCTQNPDDFAAGTRMNELAEEQTFLVAYPRQPQSANLQKCWNWFNAGDQQRDGGEPALIAGIARAVIAEFSADAGQVYVAGLSAGGAAAAIMAQTYPDLFAAAGVHSGLACGAARDMPSAFAAMSGGGAARPRGAGPAVPTIVFHGDGDRTVNPVNGDQVIAQATPGTDLSRQVTRGETPGGMAYTRTVQSDAAGREVLEHWVLHGAGHAWSGGSPAGSYTDPRGPDASREMMRFFRSQARVPAQTRH